MAGPQACLCYMQLVSTSVSRFGQKLSQYLGFHEKRHPSGSPRTMQLEGPNTGPFVSPVWQEDFHTHAPQILCPLLHKSYGCVFKYFFFFPWGTHIMGEC